MKRTRLAGVIRFMLLLALSVGFAVPARASETASFLLVGAGARALAMGGAYTALADDSNAIYWNPAGLAAVENQEFQASHAELAQSVRHDFLSYARALPVGTLGASVAYLSQEAIDGRDATGRPAGSFTASDEAASLAYGRKTYLVDIGASAKYLRSHIGSAEAQSFAFDAGARRMMGSVVLGAAIRNVGPGMKFDSATDDLPLRLSFGAGYRFVGGHSLAAELVNGPRGAGTDVGFGGEYQAIEGVFLRGGYATQTAITGGSGFDAARGLTLGFGCRRDGWNIDYAAVPMGELGSTHRFSIGVRF